MFKTGTIVMVVRSGGCLTNSELAAGTPVKIKKVIRLPSVSSEPLYRVTTLDGVNYWLWHSECELSLSVDIAAKVGDLWQKP